MFKKINLIIEKLSRAQRLYLYNLIQHFFRRHEFVNKQGIANFLEKDKGLSETNKNKTQLGKGKQDARAKSSEKE